MKILAADDQPIILKSIEHKLAEVGFEVFTALDGEEAIRLFDLNQPDMAILDLNMPNKSGFEVIQYIRKTKSSTIPIIVMSGDDEEQTIVEAFNMGINDYIEKPVRVNEVIVRVQRLLNIQINLSDLQEKGKLKSGLISKNGIGVVIPCYNEEKRLKTKEFAHFLKNNYGYHLCFVNDGSKDNTLEVLKEFQKGQEDYISVYNCEKNGGKAEAVRQGVLFLSKDKSLDFIGFLDADLSTNFADFDDLAKTIATSEYKLVAGSRISRMGANIIKQSSRGIISKTINKIIRSILGMEFQDTQCGAKIMTREVAENMFNTPFLTRWLFDVEIFLRMKQYYGAEKVEKLICEQPLKRWVHEDGSKLSMKDSFKILGQLFSIAINYRLSSVYTPLSLKPNKAVASAPKEPNNANFKIIGDFTNEQALEYKHELHTLANAKEGIKVDLRKVKKADIVGINALATTYKILNDKGGKLSLIAREGTEIYHLLQITKLSKVIDIQ